MSRPRALLAAAALAASALLGSGGVSAATKTFKCIVGGRTVYQQQACPVDAEPAKPAASEPQATASAASSASAVRRVKPPSHPASGPATRR